ncbi:hypothetical protein R1flu_005555 [Riccia fluitans]|uniref:DUF4283 domain-containing protein n=1 Tax=Riccia fluitans TaxID=41844 RepID=A0ABD1YTI1_9MARC
MPSKDVVAGWAEIILHQEMGNKAERVRRLNKHCYLNTVEDIEDRDKILDATPLYLGSHMIFALLWDSSFDPAELESIKVPVWVELLDIHPGFEGFGKTMLQTMGEVLYTTCEETYCRLTSIKGCLRLDLQQELPESVEVIDPEMLEVNYHLVLYRIGKEGKKARLTTVESANPYAALDIDQPEDEQVLSAEPIVLEENQNIDRDPNISVQQTFIAIEEQQPAEMDSAKEKGNGRKI